VGAGDAPAALVTKATVRAATRDDVDALIVLRSGWSVERRGARLDPGFADRFRAWFDDEARQRRFWIAEVDDAPAGMVNLFTFARMPVSGEAAGGWGYLANLYVVPEQRESGVGRRLVDALVAHADAAGLERVVLSPSEQSLPLFRHAGFDPADQLLLRRHTPRAVG
jgi:N-acetylglutamate synthase-like GNAT family acetyltransferase